MINKAKHYPSKGASRLIENGILWIFALFIICFSAIPSTAYADDLTTIKPTFRNYDQRKGEASYTGANMNPTGLSPHKFMPDTPGDNTFGMPTLQSGGITVREVSENGMYVRNIAFKALCPEGVLTEKIVRCFQNHVKAGVEKVIASVQISMNAIAIAAIILAVTLFGLSIIAGSCHNPGTEAFVLLMKIGGVLLLSNIAMLTNIVDMVFGSMESLAEISASYLSSGEASEFISSCGAKTDAFTGSVWARIDCILMRLFVGDVATGLGVGLLWLLATVIFWTNFMGPFVFLVMLFGFVFIALLIIRSVYTFMQCYALLGIAMIIAPICVPLILFKRTSIAFDKWLKFVFGMMIQPMFILVFLSFFFAIMDQLFFVKNDYSLVNYLGEGWETPRYQGTPPQEPSITDMMKSFERDTGFGPGSPQYDQMIKAITQRKVVEGMGFVTFEEQPLFNIDLFQKSDDDASEGDFVGYVAEGFKDVLNKLGHWIQEKISPFWVWRIKLAQNLDGSFSTVDQFMSNITAFFLLVIFLVYLLMDFAGELPQIMRKVTDVNAGGGTKPLPFEVAIKAAVNTAKSLGKDVVSGAAKGFLTGGKKGALKGAAQGFQKSASKGMKRQGTGGGGGSGAGGLASKAAGAATKFKGAGLIKGAGGGFKRN